MFGLDPSVPSVPLFPCIVLLVPTLCQDDSFDSLLDLADVFWPELGISSLDSFEAFLPACFVLQIIYLDLRELGAIIYNCEIPTTASSFVLPS